MFFNDLQILQKHHSISDKNSFFYLLVALCKSSGAALHQFHINNFNSRIKVSSANYLFMLKPHKLPKIFFSLAQTQTKHSLAKPYYVLYLKRIFNLYSRSSNFLVHCFTMIFGSLKASFHIYQVVSIFGCFMQIFGCCFAPISYKHFQSNNHSF